eukprot:scaffold10886_cov84-Cylindrotheca_fusiformis.AAC.2
MVGIDQLSKARMMVPQQSSIANVRSTFRSSNDGSAAIIHWECQLSRDDRPFLFPRLGSSDFQGSIDGSATVICQQLKKASENIPRSWLWIDEVSDSGMMIPQQSPVQNGRRLYKAEQGHGLGLMIRFPKLG